MASHNRSRMNLKRIEDNHNYIIDVNNSDNIYSVKNKLSVVTKLNCDGIVLIHKNRILKNDKLIIDYNIDENDFVLFSNVEIDFCYDIKLNRYKKNYFEKYCIFCYDKIIELENDKPKQLNDIEKINITIDIYYPPESLSISVNRNEIIYDELKERFIDPNKCEICNKYKLCRFGSYLDENKTFADNGIRNDDKIYFIKLLRGGSLPIIITCITGHYDTFEIHSDDTTNIINQISKEIKIPQKNIKLFQDKNRSKPIKTNYDLPKYEIDRFQIDIYFFIKTDFDNLVKLEKLGKGSFGTVFKCVSIETKGEIAVKMLKIPSINEAKEDKLSFERELQVYSKYSDHPRIVKYERNFQTENAIFLVMEYMKGGSLGSYLRKNGPLSEEKIKKYSKQILEALQYLHEQKILHRDIKSDNILLDEGDNVKLCDFGLSKILTDLATKDFLNGVCQTFVGTVNYMAPEIMNDEPYGPSADVWSFGATMVEMVTGFPPYHKMGVCKIVKIISESRKIEFNYPNNPSANLKSFIDSCLQSEPARRLSTEQLMNHSFLQICSTVTFL